MAGGLPGGARDLPVGDRPDGRVPRLRLHVRLGRLPRSGSRRATPSCSSGSASASRGRLAGRSAAGGSSPTATSRGRVVRAAGALRPALPARRFGLIATTGATSTRSATTRRSRRSCKSGLDSYVFLRPGRTRRSCRPLFWWESPDGSRVLAYRIPHEYCSAARRPRRARREGARATAADAERADVLLRRRQPRRRADEREHRQHPPAERAATAAAAGCSSPRAFFDAVARRTASCRCVTASCSTTPRLLLGALGRQALEPPRREPAAARGEVGAVADVLGARRTRPSELDRGLEARALQPVPRHPGRHGDRAGVRGRARPVRPRASLAANAFNRAVQTIARRIDIPAEAEPRPLVVFNPHPWPLRDRRRARVHLAAGGRLRVTDDEGEPVLQPIAAARRR